MYETFSNHRDFHQCSMNFIKFHQISSNFIKFHPCWSRRLFVWASHIREVAGLHDGLHKEPLAAHLVGSRRREMAFINEYMDIYGIYIYIYGII